jgi:uroporphyrinogen decarboxylase
MNKRENFLRTVEFQSPEWIPCHVSVSAAIWRKYPNEMRGIALAHPQIISSKEMEVNLSNNNNQGGIHLKSFRDNWGCVWQNEQDDDICGQVIEHPLADWSVLSKYHAPDPEHQAEFGPRDWENIKTRIEADRKNGQLTVGNGERLFDRLYFLRGFENLMVDIGVDDPNLSLLIDMLKEYELKLVNKYLGIGVDVMGFHTDIGTQQTLMISPEKFRKYIKPLFMSLFQPCRKVGTHVSLSSDGNLLEIVDDLVECGVSVHDPQLRANTIKGIAKAYRLKLCANVDLDRQSFPFAKPDELRDQVKEVIETMGDPKGGLMVFASISRDTPLKNIEAICNAMEDYCFP